MPMNSGKPWSEAQDHTLRKLVEQGRTAAQIAKSLGRTEHAINLRIHKIMPDSYQCPYDAYDNLPTEEIPMNIEIENVTLINGERADKIRPDKILDMIREQRSRLKELRELLPPESSYVDRQAIALNNTITQLMILLDKYHTPSRS